MTLVGFVAIALLGLETAVASAADVSLNGTTVMVNGTNDDAGGGNGNAMTVDLGPGAGQITVTDTAVSPSTTDPGCTDNGNNVVCNVTPAEFNITSSVRNDTVTVLANTPAIIDGLDGNDTLQGGGGGDRLFDGGGNDTLKGGGGADQLFQEAGSDTLDGEGGSDVVDAVAFFGAEVADTFRDTGATGTDSIGYFSSPTGVDLHIDDGLANDGTAGGAEGDLLGPGFESIAGSGQDDEIFGSAAAETLLAGGGEDDITGGNGADSLVGGMGVDHLIANDGVADADIDCGDGAGEVAAIDAIDPAPVSCENVQTGGAADTDGDGVPDSSDNCPTVANASQANADGDTQGDVCDADDDNDGVPDTSDNCPNQAAATPDGCPAGGGGGGAGDADGDGVPDASDNCSAVANASQANADGDAQGDVCDADDDNDNVPDTSDACPNQAAATANGCPSDGEGITAPVGAVVTSLLRGRMPKVAGLDVDEARDAITKKFPGAAFDLDFVKSCQATKNLEVIKQSPAAEKKLSSTATEPLIAKLDVCLGDDDFLNECDTSSLKQDMKPLAGKIDGSLAMAVAGQLADCKVDYDVKISQQAEEAAKLAAQGKKKKGEIKLAVDCPAEGDLIASVGQGFKVGGKDTFGVRVNGDENELWTLPAPTSKGSSFFSIVSLTVKDTAGQWPVVSAIVDDDSVNPSSKKTDVFKSREGVVTIPVTATQPGALRICVIQETAGAELLTKSIEIDVIPAPKFGSDEIYKTANGQYFQFAADGLKKLTADQAGAAARPTLAGALTPRRDLVGCLFDLWNCVSSLFNGRSQTISSLDGDGTVSRPRKVSLASEQAQLGIAQIAMGPNLQAFPGQPVIVTQDCIVLYQRVYYLTKCPVITAPGGAALVGANNGGGAGIVAAGGGNILGNHGGAIVAAGAGNLIGSDGATLIGSDGASIVAAGAGNLVGNAGNTMVAAGGLNQTNGIVAAGGGNAIQPDTAGIVAAGGLNLIGSDGASIVAAGAGNLVGNGGNTLIQPGGLK